MNAHLSKPDDGLVLEDVVGFLRCPVCSHDVVLSDAAVRCEAGHTFDIARQGYVNLIPGGLRPGSADTAAMVGARQAFLGTGLLRPLADLLAERAADLCTRGSGCVVDVGAGTGYYLAAVLDRTPGHAGAALDLSKYAAARAARAHHRIGAVVCDAWRPLPVRDGAASAILNVCAPRNGPEFRRVVRSDGVLLVVTPTTAHLVELVGALGLLSVDRRKPERVGGALDAHFEATGATAYETRLRLTRDQVETLVLMGPNAHHVNPETLHDRVAALPDVVEATVAFDVSSYVPKPSRPPPPFP